jgi:hypothetical protein
MLNITIVRFLPLALLSLCLTKGSWCMDTPDDHNSSNKTQQCFDFPSLSTEIKFHIVGDAFIDSIVEFGHANNLKLVCKSWNSWVTEGVFFENMGGRKGMISYRPIGFRTNKNFRYMGEHTYTHEYHANGWIGETQNFDEYEWPVGIFFEHSNHYAPEKDKQKYDNEKDILNAPIQWTFERDKNDNIIWVAKIHTYIEGDNIFSTDGDNIFSTDIVRFKYDDKSISQIGISCPSVKKVRNTWFSWSITSTFIKVYEDPDGSPNTIIALVQEPEGEGIHTIFGRDITTGQLLSLPIMIVAGTYCMWQR